MMYEQTVSNVTIIAGADGLNIALVLKYFYGCRDGLCLDDNVKSNDFCHFVIFVEKLSSSHTGAPAVCIYTRWISTWS